MTALLLRTTANYLVRSRARIPLNCCSSFRPVLNISQHLSSRAFTSCAALNAHKISTKRTLAKQTDSIDDESWSIIAYNLSEELQIENAALLFKNLEEYDLVDLPEDLRREAIILRFKGCHTTKRGYAAKQPLHDIFISREGTLVFWGVPSEQQKKVLNSISTLDIHQTSKILMQDEKEHLNYTMSQSIDKSKLNQDNVQLAIVRTLDQLDLDQFAFSHAVALSVKLAIWETMLDNYIQSISWVTNNIKTGKTIHLTRDQVFRKTGEIYEMKHRLNLSSDFLDLPDIYWDRHDQEIIFLSMISYLNIKKRTTVMNEKLNNCCELMNLLAGHMNDKHHVRLEWMIIVLIMVEVLFEIARFF